MAVRNLAPAQLYDSPSIAIVDRACSKLTQGALAISLAVSYGTVHQNANLII